MDFYYVNYFCEFLKNGIWERYSRTPNKIIVIASDIVEAKNKIDECITIYNDANNNENKRYKITSEITKTNGLNVFHDFGHQKFCPIHKWC